MAENMILFKRGLKENLPATRDNNTLYFVTNTGELYLGNTLIADKTGDYAAAIANAINALDATVNSGDDNLVKITVTQEDGKLTSVTVDDTKLDTALADYYTKEEVEDLVSDLDVGALEGRMDAVEEDITAINNATTGILAQAKGYTDTEVGKVQANVTTLIGDDTGTSVRAIAANEVAKIVAGADENFDTLKEVSDWIASDTEGAAAMQNAIAAIKKEIGGTQNTEGFENSRIDALQSGKVDKVSGATEGNLAKLKADGSLVDSGNKATDFATAAQGAKADTAVQSVSLASGSTNGTVKLTVDGTVTDNIAVTGLGSAAYVETTAFDAAGAAAAVQGSTTNTVKDCVDAINTLNNTMDSVDTNNKALIGTVNNVVNQLTWGSF